MQLAIAIILACCAVGAGLCTGIGAIGDDIGVGGALAKSCEATGRQPEATGAITSTMIIDCAITESTGIYSLVISILLIFVAPSMFINTLVNGVKALKELGL